MAKRKTLRYSALSDNRSIIMGIAIILIVLFHARLDVGPILKPIKDICYGGVDIFFFISGLGCFYSLSKDNNAYNFMKRRLAKLLPMFWIFLIAWTSYRIAAHNAIPLKALLGNFLLIQDFAVPKYSFNWYISAIFLFYLLAPLLFSIVKKSKPITTVATIAALIIASLPFIGNGGMIIIATRLPIFYIGMVFGKLSKNDKAIRMIHLILLSVLAIIGFIALYVIRAKYPDLLWSHGLYWYPLILTTPALCVLSSILFGKIRQYRIPEKGAKVFGFIGAHTFEVYLCHILLFELYGELVARGKIIHSNISMLLFILLIIPCSLALYWVTKLFLRIFSKIRSKVNMW